MDSRMLEKIEKKDLIDINMFYLHYNVPSFLKAKDRTFVANIASYLLGAGVADLYIGGPMVDNIQRGFVRSYEDINLVGVPIEPNYTTFPRVQTLEETFDEWAQANAQELAKMRPINDIERRVGSSARHLLKANDRAPYGRGSRGRDFRVELDEGSVNGKRYIITSVPNKSSQIILKLVSR